MSPRPPRPPLPEVVDLNLPCAHPGCNRMVDIKQPRERMTVDERGRVVDYGVTPLCDEHAPAPEPTP